MKPVLGHGGPGGRVTPQMNRGISRRSCQSAWDMSNRARRRRQERVSKARSRWIQEDGIATAWTTDVRWNALECA